MDTVPLTVHDYLRALMRRRWLLLIMVVCTLAGALTMTVLQKPIYRSEAEILVEPRPSTEVFQQEAEPLAQNLDRAIQTEIRVVEGELVRMRVRDNLGLASLPPRVDATADGTDVVTISVRSKDKGTAQVLADAYVEAYINVRREQAVANLEAAGGELESQISDLQAQIEAIDLQLEDAPNDSLAAQRQALVNQQATFSERLSELQIDAALTTGGVSFVRPADVPDDPLVPTPRRTLILALIAGIIFGIAAALLVDYLDESVASADDVAAAGGPPVLAVVPVEAPHGNLPMAMSSPTSHSVESYRGLRTNVLFLGLDSPLRVIQLTSALPGEGKTTTATNLAVVLAAADKRVVLVDADLRKPRVHTTFGIDQMPGLTEVILGHPVDDALRVVADGLSVLPAGSAPANAGEMLLSQRVANVLRTLSEQFDFVIIDSPPVLPVADAVGIAGAVDGVLLVAQAKRLSRRALADAMGRLDQVGASVFGAVLNQAPKGRGAYGAYGYGYGFNPAPAGATEQRVADDRAPSFDELPLHEGRRMESPR